MAMKPAAPKTAPAKPQANASAKPAPKPTKKK